MFCPLARSLLLALVLAPAASAQSARPSRVTIAPTGALVINGKPTFCIGLTMPPPPDGKAPDGRPALAAVRASGIRLLRTGPTAGAWTDTAVEAELRYLDAASAQGLYCMPYLRELADLRPQQPQRQGRLRELIARIKDHPGLGVYKGADEPEWGKVPVEGLLRARQLIHELDPNHPLWIVQAPRGTVESLNRYDGSYDILGCDIYPIGYPPGMHSLLPHKEISMVGDYTREMMEVAGGKKPVWMTLQIAWSGVIKPGKTLRMPTFPQERFMAYEAVINGARGLVFFGGHLRQAWTEQDQKLGWNWSFWGRILEPVVKELSPDGELGEALVSAAPRMDVKVDGADDVEFCLRDTGDAVYLLACKREGKTVQVRFSGLGVPDGEVRVVYEEPRRVSVSKGMLVDWFAPFDVHVYKLPARQAREN